jgi:predicted dinucleotide-binding enzyme
MKIGVLGTGRVGTTLGSRWAKAGHAVTFGSRDPGRLAAFVEPLGDRARAATYAEAVEAVLYLLAGASYTTGALLRVDGGRALA